MKKVATHVKVEGGEDVSLASVCLDILNDHSHIHGAKSHSNKSRKRVIDEKRYFKREVDEAPGSGAKFKAVGFRENEAKCSLAFMYNLRADPQLILFYSGKMVIAIRPCMCAGCKKKLEEPIETRYIGKCDTCIYWKIFKKRDGQSGYNDWMIIELVPDHSKGFDEQDFQEMKEFNLETFGYRMSLSIRIGRFAAYTVDDPNYDYYLVKVDEQAKQAERTEVIQLDGEEFPVTEGEWICYGTWLSIVPNTTKWWYQTNQRCVVRL